MSEILITLLVLGIAGVGIAIYVLNFKPMRKSKVKDLYAEGLDLLITGRRKSAYKNFKDIIQEDSDNIKAYLRLGQVLREGGNASQALKVHRGLLLRRDLMYYEQIELHKNLALDYYKIGNISDFTVFSFQAVKHMCAEMIADLEPTRALLWYAAHSFDVLPDEAKANIKAIIGEGFVTINNDFFSLVDSIVFDNSWPDTSVYTWSGSLNKFEGLHGYWILSAADVDFSLCNGPGPENCALHPDNQYPYEEDSESGRESAPWCDLLAEGLA